MISWLAAIQLVLRNVHARPDELRWWRLLNYQLGLVVREYGSIGLSVNTLPRLSSLQSRILSTLWSMQEKQRFVEIRYLQQQDILHQQLTTSTDLTQVCAALKRSFQDLGIRRAWLVLYQTPATQPDKFGDLLFSLEADTHSQATELTPGRHPKDTTISASGKLHGKVFATQQVLPESRHVELGHGLLVKTPLTTGQLHFGYLLIDPSSVASLDVLSIANGVGNAICQCSRLRFLESQTEALSNINRELSRLANYDPLTGLSNRTRFQQTLKTLFTRAGDSRTGVALLFLDLDGFKLVNDTLGHSAGDQLLMVVASRLSRLLRPADHAARLGGDEFTVIIPDADDDVLPQQTATRILEVLGEPYRLHDRVINLTVSIGLATYPEHGHDVETVLKHADTAMYKAKAMGKNCLCRYSDELNRAAAARLQVDQAMRSGLANGEFSLCYQPRIDLRSGEISAFEALLRWAPHTHLDVIVEDRADEFIALAEQTGFILELDSFALESACLQAKLWQEQGVPVRIAVNMSVNQLQREGIVARIESALARHRLDPACIEIELTEGAVMTDVENNIVKLSALRELGMKIAVDDFGTGHSSLNYLKRLPVTSLKIDRSFVSDSTASVAGGSADSTGCAIIEAIVALGKSMGFRLVAEGVESDAQSRYVADLGCDEAQGFHYAGALEASEATRYLIRSHERFAKIGKVGRGCKLS